MAAGDRAVKGGQILTDSTTEVRPWTVHVPGKAWQARKPAKQKDVPGYVWEPARTQYSWKTVEQEPRAHGH